MNKKDYTYYSLGMLLLIGMFSNQVFAEVTNIQTNNELFFKGDKIEFSGTVEKGSTGLVTIVIRDINEQFVLLEQAVINYDDTFGKSLIIEDKFAEHGTYSATGFILNMTKGETVKFDVSLNGIPIIHEEQKNNENLENNENINIEKISEEKTSEQKTEEIIVKSNDRPEFVDPSKDPSHYIQRYYSESSYKSWFDRNYPNLTIEEAVGYTNNISENKSTVQEMIKNEIIPEAQASSIAEPIQRTNSPDMAQITLAIAGLGILFGAVYGVKRQVDNNSRQISLNRDIIRKKIIRPIMGSNPKEILQTRLAKGEITLEEYERLEKKISN